MDEAMEPFFGGHRCCAGQIPIIKETETIDYDRIETQHRLERRCAGLLKRGGVQKRKAPICMVERVSRTG